MANINEEDEKSEYSDEQFDEEEDEPAALPTIPRITVAKVSKSLKQIRLLFMIKKVPRTHMVKYLLGSENFNQNEESGEEIIPTKNLVTVFERKFNLANRKATKIARFFIEGSPQEEGNDAQIEQKDHTSDRESLIKRFKEHVGEFMLYNTLALDSMMSRL